MRHYFCLLAIKGFLLFFFGTAWGQDLIEISSPMTPPAWANLERALLEENSRFFGKYAEKYINPNTGHMEIVEHWGGADGPDDAMENWYNCSLLYALGAPEETLHLFDFIWNGHIDQYTELEMYYREFITSFDWEHTGEGIAPFLLLPISDPTDERTQDRIIRFADFYTGRDTTTGNYDAEHKIIRSIHNGSRGPRMSATPEDWGDRDDRHYFRDSGDWSRVQGDVPMNFLATSLVVNAYILTGDEHYRNWIDEYMGAWARRTRENRGNVPSIVGLNGIAGEGWNGKWYGGLMGWDWTFGGWFILGRGVRVGFSNAYFATGNSDYMDILRMQADNLLANRTQTENGPVFNGKFGDKGWYAPVHSPSHQSALFEGLFTDIYLWSLAEGDLRKLYDACNPGVTERMKQPNWVFEYEGQFGGGNEILWIDYLEGNNPDFPEKILRDSFERLRLSNERLMKDESTADTRHADTPHIQRIKATTTALINLTLGGAEPMWSGALLYCQLRYFDPAGPRPGLPDNVAALVTGITKEEVKVILVNLSTTESKDVILQAGAYGEHQITEITHDGTRYQVNDRFFTARIRPGCGTELTIQRIRFANKPTFAFPWHGGRVPTK